MLAASYSLVIEGSTYHLGNFGLLARISAIGNFY